MADAAEMLWVVLANVSGGDWTKQPLEWQEAAARWRDNYFAAFSALSVPPVPRDDDATPLQAPIGIERSLTYDELVHQLNITIEQGAALHEALRELADDYEQLCGDGLTATNQPDVLRKARELLEAALDPTHPMSRRADDSPGVEP